MISLVGRVQRLYRQIAMMEKKRKMLKVRMMKKMVRTTWMNRVKMNKMKRLLRATVRSVIARKIFKSSARRKYSDNMLKKPQKKRKSLKYQQQQSRQ